jgi:aldehyde:ferredoxin oxidoreductase
MGAGIAGRIGFVDLTTGAIEEQRLEDELARDFIGGYGLGARIMFQRQRSGEDPLGPGNILGFTTGPLTGTQAPTGGRYMAVCKSPLTGGWGDANSGGYFGSELKSAGWDAIFVSGIAPSPKYLLVTDDGLELRDASHLWGKDTTETEDFLRDQLQSRKIRVACIGPASERRSLITGIVNDKGRVAGRSGVGAVMGAKRLKAVAVSGTKKVPVADSKAMEQLRKKFVQELREMGGFAKTLMEYGTCGLTGVLVAGGATPIKNWILAGEQAFPTVDRIADGQKVVAYQTRKYGCANCPIACGGIFNVPKGPYPVQEAHKPEYETIAAFGTMCMNDDLLSIIKLNDICNRSGLDTISAGSVIAFAMECYEEGLITKADADGIELTWGNVEAMIAMLDKIVRREGLGDILADGVRIAAQKIGKDAEKHAVHVGGQEPGLHNALFLPSRGTGFVCDPTPGRHTAGAPMARIDTGSPVFAPYPELKFHGFERLEYKNKGPASATSSCYWQVGTCAGVCLFPVLFFENYPLVEFLNAATGWDMDITEALQTGARIQTLRQAFNLREGIQSSDVKLPPRMVGTPPKSEGPLAGVSIDIETLASEYRKAMGWNPETGDPTDDTLKRLGLIPLFQDYWK